MQTPYSTRDSQRQKVYNAENHFYHATARLDTIEQVQAYVDGIVCTHFWRKYAPKITKVVVKQVHGHGARAWRLRRVIHFAPSTMYKGVILHELAHILTHSTYTSHGAEFCKMYLWLVKRFMGKGAVKFLKWSFKLHRVKTRTSNDPTQSYYQSANYKKWQASLE